MKAQTIKKSPVERAVISRERVIKSMKSKIARIQSEAEQDIAAIREKLAIHEAVLAALKKGA